MTSLGCFVVKAWPHTRENHTKLSYEKIWGNLNKIVSVGCTQQRRWLKNHNQPQSTISIIWLVNRILASVMISFLPHFSIWQFSAVCISRKTHSWTIYYVCGGHNHFVWFSRAWGQAFNPKQIKYLCSLLKCLFYISKKL